jgi:hypothetical protein
VLVVLTAATAALLLGGLFQGRAGKIFMSFHAVTSIVSYPPQYAHGRVVSSI